MALTKYTYSIQNDFPNHKVAGDRLVTEIRSSSITVVADGVNTQGDVCDVWFKDELSLAEKDVLDRLVAAHSGEPLPDEARPVRLEGVPTSSDGKPQMTPNLLPSWTSLYFAGQGDDRVNGIGAGQAFVCTS